MPVPLIIRDPLQLREAVASWQAQNDKVALVPTMGALHEGHLQLVRHGFELATHVVASIFINPTQFAPSEDLARYPRDADGDIAKLAGANVSAIYLPLLEQMYPPGFASRVQVEGPAKASLEDKFRPHFFDGVATVVAKLFAQSQADYAMFGEKDYQQLKVVARMALDLDLKTRVIGVVTARDADGLAMSSRNRYLSAEERRMAAAIYLNLQQAAKKIRHGMAPLNAARAAARSLTKLGFRVDYVAARNSETLALPQEKGEPLRLLAAACLGRTRLIDNLAV